LSNWYRIGSAPLASGQPSARTISGRRSATFRSAGSSRSSSSRMCSARRVMNRLRNTLPDFGVSPGPPGAVSLGSGVIRIRLVEPWALIGSPIWVKRKGGGQTKQNADLVGSHIDSITSHCILKPLGEMPYIEVEVRRSRTFVPAEAHGIAASWRGIATEVRGVAEALRVLGSALEAGWAGNARDHFLQEFGSMPGEVDGCAELLDSLAGQVESITVTEWETVTERVWQTESVGTKR